MTGFEVWFYFVVLPGIGSMATPTVAFLSFLTICVVIFTLAAHMVCDFPKPAIALMKTSLKACLVSTVVLLVASAIIPSEKQMAAIFLVPAVSNSERLQGIGDKTLDTLNGLLDQWLKEVSPTGKVEKKI